MRRISEKNLREIEKMVLDYCRRKAIGRNGEMIEIHLSVDG